MAAAAQGLVLKFASNPIVDSSPNHIPIALYNGATAVGGAMVCNFSAAISASDPRLVVGAGDFDITFLVLFNAASPWQSHQLSIMDTRDVVGAGRGFYIFITTNSQFGWFDGATIYTGAAGAMVLGQKYAVKLQRISGVVSLIVNGNLVTKNAVAANFLSKTIYIACAQYTPPLVDSMSGLLEDFNFIIGSEAVPITAKLFSGLNNFTRLLKA